MSLCFHASIHRGNVAWLTQHFLNPLNLKFLSMPFPFSIKVHLPPFPSLLSKDASSLVPSSPEYLEENCGEVVVILQAALENVLEVKVGLKSEGKTNLIVGVWREAEVECQN
jgi:hypothetical protein